MTQTVTFLIGRNDRNYSLTVRLRFASRGIRLQRRLTSSDTIFCIEDELDTTTSASNVYAAIPLNGDLPRKDYFFLTEMFDMIDNDSEHNAQFVDEMNILSWTHLRKFDIPKLTPLPLMVDRSTSMTPIQTNITSPETDPSTDSSDNNDGNDLFDLFITPVIIPLAITNVNFDYAHSCIRHTIGHTWETLRTRANLDGTRFQVTIDTSKNVRLCFKRMADAWLNVHQGPEIEIISTGDSHYCNFGYCFINWNMLLIAAGRDDEPSLRSSLSFLLRIIDKYFYTSNNVLKKEFLEHLMPMFRHPYPGNIISIFIQEAPTKIQSDLEFYDHVCTKYIHHTFLEEFYTRIRDCEKANCVLQRNPLRDSNSSRMIGNSNTPIRNAMLQNYVY